MKSITYIIKCKEDWEMLAQYILKHYPHKKIFLLYGNLGAGKTTLVQAFGKILNVTEHITSPTFSIMHEYHFQNKQKISLLSKIPTPKSPPYLRREGTSRGGLKIGGYLLPQAKDTPDPQLRWGENTSILKSNKNILDNSEKIYHFDLYRLKNVEELKAIGFEDILYNDYYLCFIEWPDIAEKIIKESELKDKTIQLKINLHHECNSREVNILLDT